MNTEKIESNIGLVEVFHHFGGHPTSNHPTLLTLGRTEKRIAWMTEELNEFRDAIIAGDYQGAMDAMGDLQYFLFGTVIEMGGQSGIFEQFFKRIHLANMSKFCATKQLATETVKHYADKGINVHFEQVEDFYVIYFSDGPNAGKIAKSMSWHSPVFDDIILNEDVINPTPAIS